MNLIDYISDAAAAHFRRVQKFGGHAIVGPVEQHPGGSIGFRLSRSVCNDYGLDEGCSPMGSVSFYKPQPSRRLLGPSRRLLGGDPLRSARCAGRAGDVNDPVLLLVATIGIEEMNGFLEDCCVPVNFPREDMIKLRLSPAGNFIPSQFLVDDVLVVVRNLASEVC